MSQWEKRGIILPKRWEHLRQKLEATEQFVLLFVLCVSVHTCMHVFGAGEWGSEDNLRCHSTDSIHVWFFIWALSLAWIVVERLSWIFSKPKDPPTSAFQHWDYMDIRAYRSWGLNPGLHACNIFTDWTVSLTLDLTVWIGRTLSIF